MSVSPPNHRLVSVVCPGPPQKQTAELSFCFWLSEMSPSLLDWGWSGVIHFALLHPKWLLFVLRLRDNGAEMASGQWWHTSLSVRIQSRLQCLLGPQSHMRYRKVAVTGESVRHRVSSWTPITTCGYLTLAASSGTLLLLSVTRVGWCDLGGNGNRRP